MNVTFRIPGIDYTYSIYDNPLVKTIFELRANKGSDEQILEVQNRINKSLSRLDEGFYELSSYIILVLEKELIERCCLNILQKN